MPPTSDPGEHPAESDPLARASARDLVRIARRAARSRTRRDGLALLAAEIGVEERRLRLLADAWAEAGRSGVESLGPGVALPAVIAAHAEAALQRWRSRHYPLELLRWETWRNRITVWRVLPPNDRHGAASSVPLLQLRVTHEGRWHLYRRASRGEWWPVTVRGPGRQQTIEDCLEAARLDHGNRFWSARPTVPALPDMLPDVTRPHDPGSQGPRR
jgi:hypothetical protein